MALSYRALQTITASGLASLASSSTLLAGYELAEYDNSSNKDTGAFLSGSIMTGSSPTAGQIQIWAFTRLDDTPTYPDVFGGTAAAKTVTSSGIRNAGLRLVWSVDTTTTSNQAYPFDGIDLAQFFGGTLPPYVSLFVTHSTVAALNATGTNFSAKLRPYAP